ncbi:MAG: carboxypeptidase regulatory-like domain-containing protein [Deltaproteobacteria bacterium]|nr:MAG: carboxypeptidase regulatory-like domain-containing protein [Deltaproteobacteria bacterium]
MTVNDDDLQGGTSHVPGNSESDRGKASATSSTPSVRRRRRWITIAGLLLLLCAGLLAALILSLRDGPVSMDALSSDVGQDELRQIFGPEETEEGMEPAPGPSPEAETSSHLLRGQVLRPNGEPAPGAMVTAQAAEDESIHEALADSGGLFVFDDLPPGLYVVEASLPGFGPALAIGVRPRAAPLRMVLQGGRDVYGIVTHEAEPVPGAVLHVGSAGMFPQRTVVADQTGRFRLSGLRPGRYEVVATATGLGSGFGGRLIVDDDAGTQDDRIEVSLERARPFRLDVVDRRTAEPVPGVVLTIAEHPMHVVSMGQLLPDGGLDVDFLPRGTYAVRVRAPGYLPWEGELHIGGRPPDQQIRLSRGATVRGTVRDEAGNPLPRVSLSALVETPDGARWEMRRNHFDDLHRLVRPDGTLFWVPSFGYVTRHDGRFELAGIPAGDVMIVAESAGRAPAVSSPLTLHADAVYEPLEFVLPMGRRIRGRVEDRTGAGIGGAQVSLRPVGIPDWVPGTSVQTTSNGVFVLEGAPALAQLSVRHPDFAAIQIDVDVPESGRDGLIIQLSGEEMLSLSGRVFTERGAPAAGAVVWMMRGRTDLPVCRATVQEDAFFHATHCTANPERIVISHPRYAPLIGELGGVLEARDWRLRRGGELEVVSQRTPVVASVRPLFQLPASLWQRPEVDLDRWSRHLHGEMAPGNYEVRCRAEGFEDHVIEVSVDEGRRVEAVCPSLERRMRLPLYVVDHLGAPVRGALVFMDGVEPPVREVTDGRGRIHFESSPGVWAVVEAMHEDWGRGRMDLYVPWREPSVPLRVQLDQGVAGADPEGMLDLLAEWGIAAVVDGRSVIIDTIARGEPAAQSGLRRHDRLLWARSISEMRFSVGVRRDGELLTFELVRAASP